MARLFDDGLGHYASYGAAILTAAPITLSMWVYPDSGVEMGYAWFPTASTDNSFLFGSSGTGVYWRNRRNTTDASATTANSYNSNAWNHVVGVEISASSRSCMLNGGTIATDSTNQTPSGTINNFYIGTYTGGGSAKPMSGRIAEIGLWNVALTADEQMALAKGFSPLLIRPQSLQGYWPIDGISSPEIDRWNSRRNLTLNGSPAKADGPRMYLPMGVG